MSDDILKVMESIREEDRADEACKKKEAEQKTTQVKYSGSGTADDPLTFPQGTSIRVTRMDRGLPAEPVELTRPPRVKADMPDLDGEAEEADAEESEYEGTVDDLIKKASGSVTAPDTTTAPAVSTVGLSRGGRVSPPNPLDTMDVTRPPKDLMVGHQY